MPAKPRDPRVDPQPGDVLIIGPQWESERYEVVGRETKQAGYGRFLEVVLHRFWGNGAILATPLSSWLEIADCAEVIRTAEVQE